MGPKFATGIAGELARFMQPTPDAANYITKSTPPRNRLQVATIY